MRRALQETIAQLLVREDELFVELQQALKPARQEREMLTVTEASVGADAREPPVSCS